MEVLKPKLRFHEFKDDWILKKLNEISKIYDGTHQTPEYVDLGIPFYSVEHVTANQFENTKFISEDVFEKENKRVKLEKGDILMTRIGSIGVTKYIDWDVNASFYVSLALLKVKKNYNSEFVNHFISSPFFQSELWKRTIHVAFPQKINLGEIGDCMVILPSNDEQLKIANFLSSVDKKINQLTEKKSLLEQYKKGVMQKIFNQEIRFKDDNNNDFPDWVEKKLGDIGYTLNGLSGKTKEDFGSGKPYIQYMQIFSGSKINVEDFGLVNINENETQTKVQYGDIFFTTSSETPNEIGTTSVLLDKVEDVYLNSFCFGYRPNSLDEIVPEFAQFLFRSQIMRDKIIPLAQGSTRFNMSKVELMKLDILLPSKVEQTKIANFLSSIDDKINLVNSQLENTKDFKKGLLQQMFV